MNTLDLAALRTFVAAVDLGGFGRAARAVHRTPGAVSQQLKALEERLQQPMFVREGKRQWLTPAGETLLSYARRLLNTNDEALLALQGMNASGDLRLGMPQDLADSWLASALARVARSYPAVRVQVQVGRSADLRQAVDGGELDLAIAFAAGDALQQQVARLEVQWWGQAELSLPRDAPLPLLVLEGHCLFRDAAVQALEQAGRPWRIAMSSSSVSAIWAAAAAGLGVTARTGVSAPAAVRVMDGAWRLPPLAAVGLCVHAPAAGQHALVDYLSGLLRDAYSGGAMPS